MLSCRIYTCSACIFLDLDFISYFSEYYVFPNHSEDPNYNHAEASLVPMSFSFHLEEIYLQGFILLVSSIVLASFVPRVQFSQCSGEDRSLSLSSPEFCNFFPQLPRTGAESWACGVWLRPCSLVSPGLIFPRTELAGVCPAASRESTCVGPTLPGSGWQNHFSAFSLL